MDLSIISSMEKTAEKRMTKFKVEAATGSPIWAARFIEGAIHGEETLRLCAAFRLATAAGEDIQFLASLATTLRRESITGRFTDPERALRAARIEMYDRLDIYIG